MVKVFIGVVVVVLEYIDDFGDVFSEGCGVWFVVVEVFNGGEGFGVLGD